MSKGVDGEASIIEMMGALLSLNRIIDNLQRSLEESRQAACWYDFGAKMWHPHFVLPTGGHVVADGSDEHRPSHTSILKEASDGDMEPAPLRTTRRQTTSH